MPHHKATKFMKYFIFIMYSDVTCIFSTTHLITLQMRIAYFEISC